VTVRTGFALSFGLASTIVLGATQAPVFRSRVDLVSIDVSVRAGSRVVGDLASDDFEVRDNGRRQVIRELIFESAPIETTLLVDMSGSVTGPLLNALVRATETARTRVRPGDRLSVSRFSHRVRESQLAPETQLSTLLVNPAGQTSLLDALAMTLIRPRSGEMRQMVVLFTDGQDSLSFIDERTVIAIAARTEVAVFVVALTDRSMAALPHWGMFEQVTAATGGRLTAVGPNDNLSRAFVDALDTFRQSYVLRYSLDEEAEAGWHDVAVRVLRPGSFEVRARRGYTAAGPR
jgi:VWFA-related protein